MGLIDGVVATKSGWLARRGVVVVEFDPRTIEYSDLVREARKANCISPVFTRDDGQHEAAKRLVGRNAVRNGDPVRPDKETKYYLKRTPLRFVPMTGPQASRINGRLGGARDKKRSLEGAIELLSPKQRALFGCIQEHPDAGWKSALGRGFLEAWSDAEAIRRPLAATGGDKGRRDL